MAKQHLVTPFEGIGDITFGMWPEQDAQVAGPAEESEHHSIMEQTIERRGSSKFLYEDNEPLSAIYIFKSGRGKLAK